MSTPREVARDLRDRMESAKRAASNPEAGSVYAFEYLLSACEAACARLDTEPRTWDCPCGWTDIPEDYFCNGCTRSEPEVSDAEAEAVADSLVGQPVDSHVPRAYVGPGPERLAKRFPIMGGRR